MKLKVRFLCDNYTESYLLDAGHRHRRDKRMCAALKLRSHRQCSSGIGDGIPKGRSPRRGVPSALLRLPRRRRDRPDYDRPPHSLKDYTRQHELGTRVGGVRAERGRRMARSAITVLSSHAHGIACPVHLTGRQVTTSLPWPNYFGHSRSTVRSGLTA